jgi:hypothetical protein
MVSSLNPIESRIEEIEHYSSKVGRYRVAIRARYGAARRQGCNAGVQDINQYFSITVN